MADTVFTTDIKITAPSDTGEKATIILGQTGDIQMTDGQSKLAFQLMRTIVNDDTTKKLLINSSVAKRALQTLLTLILRNFKQSQIETVNNQNDSFSGYSIYRLSTGTNATYTKISTDYVQYKFTDTNLTNGTEYRYAISKAFNNTFESSFTESFSITPYAAASKQEVYLGTDIVALGGDQKVEFFVVYNRKFKGSEILDEILSMDFSQDSLDPHRYAVNIVVKDLRGSQIPIAVRRHKAST